MKTDWVDGFLLGDGHIRQVSSRSGQATMTAKYKGWLQYAMSGFSTYAPCDPRPVKRTSSRTGQVLTAWQAWTRCHPDLLVQRKRWYGTGRKSPPADLDMTPTCLRLWYLGDGCHGRGDVTIAALGLTEEEVRFLVAKVSVLGLNFSVHRMRGKMAIMFLPAAEHARFFEVVGKTDPTGVYPYKFEMVDTRGRPILRTRHVGSLRWLARELNVGRSWLKWRVELEGLNIRDDEDLEKICGIVETEYRPRGSSKFFTLDSLLGRLRVGMIALKKAVSRAGVVPATTAGGHTRLTESDVGKVREALRCR